MIYFSELKGKKVITEDNIEIGRLEDLIFLASETPKITKLVIREKNDNKLTVSVSYLIRLNSNINIKKDFTTDQLEENELYLLKNILDKQIIDLKGNKIVRVNDIAIQDKDGLYVSGVDIGLMGIFRWLKVENIFNKLFSYFSLKPSTELLSWADIQPLELALGKVKLKKEEKKLERLRPEDLADYLEKTNIVNTKKFLKIMDDRLAAEVISSLNINYQTSLFRNFSIEKATKLINFIDADDSVDMLLTLPYKKRIQIIELLNETKKREINHLIKLSESTVGGLVNSEYISVTADQTVLSVLNKIKKETLDFYSLLNVYVVNNQNQLVGVFNLHELLLQDYSTPVYKFMIQNVIVAHITTPIEIVIRKMFKYKIMHIPVIDNDKIMLGIITIVDVDKYIVSKL